MSTGAVRRDCHAILKLPLEFYPGIGDALKEPQGTTCLGIYFVIVEEKMETAIVFSV